MKKIFKSTLVKRYSLLFILIFSIMGISYLFISYGLAKHYMQQVQTQIHLHVADTIIQDHQLSSQGQINQKALSNTFRHYMLLNPYLEIYLIDLEGHVLQYSADKKKIKRHVIPVAPLEKFLHQPDLTDFPLGADPRSLSDDKPFSVAYLPNAKQSQGYLYVIIQSSVEHEANRQLQESILLRLSGWSFLSSLLIGLLLGGLLFFHLTKRITDLRDKVANFKEKPQLPIQKPIKINDEIDQLNMQLAQMSQQLHQQLELLINNDQQRRFMISSLSHDLRTPLTNLLGYMEQAEQQHPDSFLSIAYQNGLKLKHYLDQLFDYAKLDMDSFKLNYQELSLSEFCFDVFQHYESSYPERAWKINLPGNVLGQFDPDALERALRNLLDNAVKHGQGKIQLTLIKSDKTLRIEVCDEGKALSKAMSSEVFTPFFQTEFNESHQNKAVNKGSGLGLAIVKSIIEKHDGKLIFERKSGKNCFAMLLPVSQALMG